MSRLLTLLLALIVFMAPASAREEIRAFAAHVELMTNGTVEVRETIDVRAEGIDIRRGIYRDIPIVLVDDQGNRVRPTLEVVSVTREGMDEPYRIERMGDFVRIWIGDAETFLPQAVHRYVIAYTMTRMGRFFGEFDELYWNATGNYWNFPILSAVATVQLPEGAVIASTAGFTGAAGSTESAVTITQPKNNVAVFRSTRALGAGEGLTVAASFQKGILVEPSGTTGLLFWFLDRQDVFVPALAALLVLGYFSLAWNSVGRDPPKGTVIPLFHPPGNMSPALVHFIHNWGWKQSGWIAFTAAAFNLGVRGLVVIDNATDALKLSTTGKVPESALPAGESVLYNFITVSGTITIDKATGPKLARKRAEFTRAIETENRETWFRDNLGYSLAGVALSLLMLGSLVFLGYLEVVWLFVGVIAGIFGGIGISALRSAWGGKSFHVVFIIIWLGIVGFNFIGGMGALVTNSTVSAGLIAAISIVALCIVFFILMRAPTLQGRKVMDQIEGLKLYLDTAEKDRLNIVAEPPLTIERFERLLPYAIALGVEKPWSDHFESELARNAIPDSTGRGYAPHWYQGGSGSFSPGKIGGAIAGAATGMSAAMVAAQPVSTSSSGSSGGGGGFSGGGGGGGGGGGW